MIKKRYLAVAGLMVLAVAATGCGKKSEQPSTVEVTPTPTAEATPTVTLIWKPPKRRMLWVKRLLHHPS